MRAAMADTSETRARLLRAIAAKGRGSLAADASRALTSSGGASLRLFNEVATAALGADPSPLSDHERAELVECLAPAPVPAEPETRGELSALFPRIRCTPEQLERLKADARAAGYSDLSKYVRARLFG